MPAAGPCSSHCSPCPPLQACSCTSVTASGTARRTCGSPGRSVSAPATWCSPAAAWRRGCRRSSPAPSLPLGCQTPTRMTAKDDTPGDGGTWLWEHLTPSLQRGQRPPPPPSPGPFDSGATGAAPGMWLHPEMTKMLALPHPLRTERGAGGGWLPPSPSPALRNWVSAPSAQGLPCSPGAADLSADLSTQPGMQRVPGDQGRQPSSAHSGSHLAAAWALAAALWSPPASC